MTPEGAQGIGCPNGECEHDIGQHDRTDIGPVCSVPGCPCGSPEGA